MARLNAKQRRAMPQSEYALSGKRYPVNDHGHAVAAKARAEEEWAKGKLSAEQRDKVIARANAKLGKKGKHRG